MHHRFARSFASSLLTTFTVALAACSSSSTDSAAVSDSGALDETSTTDGGNDVATDAGVDSAPAVDEAALVAARPFHEKVPKGYDASKATPLIVLLHGFGVDGATQLAVFGFGALADERNVIIAYPDGTNGKDDNRYWNATDACCGAGKNPPDDVAYLTAVVHDVEKRYHVDPKQVFVVGHSNGGFMAHRLACERADVFAAAVSLAGAQWTDVSHCKPSRPVSVLQVHGDADGTIAYGGGNNVQADGSEVTYPSAAQTVADWAKLDGCTGALADSGTTLDLETSLAGNETKVSRYAGCPAGVSVELWTIQGGSHIPEFGPTWGTSVLDFLEAHPLP